MHENLDRERKLETIHRTAQNCHVDAAENQRSKFLEGALARRSKYKRRCARRRCSAASGSRRCGGASCSASAGQFLIFSNTKRERISMLHEQTDRGVSHSTTRRVSRVGREEGANRCLATDSYIHAAIVRRAGVETSVNEPEQSLQAYFGIVPTSSGEVNAASTGESVHSYGRGQGRCAAK